MRLGLGPGPTIPTRSAPSATGLRGDLALTSPLQSFAGAVAQAKDEQVHPNTFSVCVCACVGGGGRLQ
eukprot:6756407-Alexandrium_andersonii.AAC.1